MDQVEVTMCLLWVVSAVDGICRHCICQITAVINRYCLTPTLLDLERSQARVYSQNL
jgi:hypothetical protein